MANTNADLICNAGSSEQNGTNMRNDILYASVSLNNLEKAQQITNYSYDRQQEYRYYPHFRPSTMSSQYSNLNAAT